MIKKLITAILLAALIFPAGIADAASGSVTEYYRDEDGNSLAGQTSGAGIERSGKDIDGYTLTGYSEDIYHYYSRSVGTHGAYITGYADGSVKPDGNITRAEAAVIFYRLDGSPSVSAASGFTDVSNPALWYYDAVVYLQSSGIISGYADMTFRPAEPISRAELAVIAARYAKLDTSAPGTASFGDVGQGQWYYNAVTAAADKGWINGYSGGIFKPDGKITRAETVTILNRMLERSAVKGQLPQGAGSFTDLPESHWAYADIMEAAVTHSAADWHGGAQASVYAYVTERFFDSNGVEIEGSVKTATAPKAPSKTFDGYRYSGSETTVVYTYIKDGASGYHGAFAWLYTDVTHNTGANISGVTGWVVPGDSVIYTLRVDNATDAVMALRGASAQDITAAIENAVATIYLPSRLKYEGIDAPSGVQASYDPAGHELTLTLGDIALGESVSVRIMTTVTKSAGVYREAISTDAVAASDNYEAWGGFNSLMPSRPDTSPAGYKSQMLGALTAYDLDYPNGAKLP